MRCEWLVRRGYVPEFDATAVRRALEAGATIVGKNTVLGGFGETEDFRRPQNPHAPKHLTGGTSSGSAVAVVAREADISFGTDQGGSVRIPAAWSGAVGLKPTFGLVSCFGALSRSDPTVDHVGPIARTVEDAAAALQAVAGYDGLDIRQHRHIPERFDALSTLYDDVEGISIGVVKEGFDGAEPDVTELVNSAIDQLNDAGANILDVSIPEHLQMVPPYAALDLEGSDPNALRGATGLLVHSYYSATLLTALKNASAQTVDLSPAEKLQRLFREFSWKSYQGHTYAKAHNARPTLIRAYDSVFARVDILAMPTCILKAPAYEQSGDSRTRLHDALRSVAYMPALKNTLPFNYTGHPALAMPCGKSEGLPVSIQFVGRFLDDLTVLRVAYALQQEIPFGQIIDVEPCLSPREVRL